jgi:hypothetical protein
MKLSRSIWSFSFAIVAVAGSVWAVAEAQTLGKRRLPGTNPTANVSNLPISYAKSTFTLATLKMSEKMVDEDKNAIYFAPIVDTGPELPANPTFKFRIYGMRSGEWKEVGQNPALFENQGGRIEIRWYEQAKLLRLRMVNTQKQIDARSWQGVAGPMFDTLAIDVNMLDNVGKHWYYTRTVQFVESSAVVKIPLPSSN